MKLSRLIVLIGAYLALTFLATAPTSAETKQQIDWCINESRVYSPDLQISGCTASIQSGRYGDQDLAAVYSNRGEAYDNKGQHDRSIQDFDEAIRLNPKFAIAYDNRGIAYIKDGQNDRAIQDFDQAIRLNPNYFEAFNNRGQAYMNKGQHDRGIQDFDQAIRLDPKTAMTFLNRGLAWERKGNLQNALQDFKKYSELAPSDPLGPEAIARVTKALSGR